MSEDVPTLSVLNSPFVYVAFSHEANRWACATDQDYVVKIGTSKGRSDSPRDRIEALNRGFQRKGSDEVHQPLLCAEDWDALLIAFFDTIDAANSAQDEVKAESNSRYGIFDTALGKSLHPTYTNGISDILRVERCWMSSQINGFAELLAEHADPAAPAVLKQVAQVIRRLLRDLLIELVSLGLDQPIPLTYLAEGAQSLDQGVKLWKGGPLVHLQPVSELQIPMRQLPGRSSRSRSER